jgi:hypothetical protein
VQVGRHHKLHHVAATQVDFVTTLHRLVLKVPAVLKTTGRQKHVRQYWEIDGVPLFVAGVKSTCRAPQQNPATQDRLSSGAGWAPSQTPSRDRHPGRFCRHP